MTLTLDHLCAEMVASGRNLTPRAARDWWTKGLLPRPQRRGLGRGRGTETFWIEPKIVEQAQTVYDLFLWRPRADIAILGLWLLGFPVDLRRVRDVYESAHRCPIGKALDDVASESAILFVHKNAEFEGVLTNAKSAGINLALEFFNVFYGAEDQFESFGLSDYWEEIAPHLKSDYFANMHLRDADFATYADYLRQVAALPAQHEAIVTASDYELIRARRLVHFVFGYIARVARMARCGEELDEMGRCLLVAIGGTAIPILINLLRHDRTKQKVLSAMLDFVKMIPRSRGMSITNASVDYSHAYH